MTQNGKTAVDMTYRFTWDTEPTEEQLGQLMEEVAEDVRREQKEVEQKIKISIQNEVKRLQENNK